MLRPTRSARRRSTACSPRRRRRARRIQNASRCLLRSRTLHRLNRSRSAPASSSRSGSPCCRPPGRRSSPSSHPARSGPGASPRWDPPPGPVALAVGLEVILGAGILLLSPRARAHAHRGEGRRERHRRRRPTLMALHLRCAGEGGQVVNADELDTAEPIDTAPGRARSSSRAVRLPDPSAAARWSVRRRRGHS